jgi:hypothetical protein
MSGDAPRTSDVDALTEEVKRLKTENARLRKENDGLSDMVRTGGGRSGSKSAVRFLAGVGVGLVLAYVTMLMWSHQGFGGPFIKMF